MPEPPVRRFWHGFTTTTFPEDVGQTSNAFRSLMDPYGSSPRNTNTAASVPNGAAPTQRTYLPYQLTTLAKDPWAYEARGWGLPLADTVPVDTRQRAYLPSGSNIVFGMVVRAENSNSLSLGSNQAYGLWSMWAVSTVTHVARQIVTAFSALKTIAGPPGLGGSGFGGTHLSGSATLGADMVLERDEVLVVQCGLYVQSVASPATGSNTATFRMLDNDIDDIAYGNMPFVDFDDGLRTTQDELHGGEGRGDAARDVGVLLDMAGDGVGAGGFTRAAALARSYAGEARGTGGVTKGVEKTLAATGVGTVRPFLKLAFDDLGGGGAGIRRTALYVFDD